MAEKNKLIKFKENEKENYIYDKLKNDFEKEKTLKQQIIFEILCKKHLYEALLTDVDKTIQTYQTDESLMDIFIRFIDSAALEQGNIKIKNR